MLYNIVLYYNIFTLGWGSIIDLVHPYRSECSSLVFEVKVIPIPSVRLFVRVNISATRPPLSRMIWDPVSFPIITASSRDKNSALNRFWKIPIPRCSQLI